MKKRPLSVTIVSLLMLAVGLIGFVFHFSELNFQQPVQNDALLIEAIRLVAVVCGAFILRGQDWARWLMLAWITFHVFISAFDSLSKFGFHVALLAVLGYFLLRREAREYFRGPRDGFDPLPTSSSS